jgi:hypothetical protein
VHLLTCIKIFHLLGLVMGFGGAVLLDATLFTRGVIRPVSKYTLHQAEVLSRIVAIGLALLWVTGIGLIWLNLADKPEYLTNQKLWAKIFIVVLLTMNGVFIHHKVLPLLKQRVGQRLFDSVGRTELAVLTLIGSISFVSWTTPFILGKASELNYVTPIWVILGVYFAAVAVIWSILFIVMGSIAAIQNAITKAAAKTMLSSASWENADMSVAVSAQALRMTSQNLKVAEAHKFAPRTRYAQR